MLTLKIKTRSGDIADLTVEELIAIDGQPFTDGGSLKDAVVHLEGRLVALESLLSGLISQGG